MSKLGRDGTWEQEAHVVRKGLGGRRISRRDWLKVAVAAVVTGVAASCTKEPATEEPAQACKGIRAHESWLLALAISPDGKLLASGSEGKTIKFWSLPEGKLLKTLEGHQDWVLALAMSPDGKLLASGSGNVGGALLSRDATIKLWSLPDGALLRALYGHEGSIHALAVSPDGKLLASGSADRTIELWSLPEGELLKTLQGHQWEIYAMREIYALAVSPDSKLLASGGLDGTIKLCSLPEGELITCLKDPKVTPTPRRSGW